MGKFPPAAGPPYPAVSCAVLIAALSLGLAGCAHLEPAAPVKLALIAPAEPKLAPDPVAAPKPAEAPAKPAPPAPQASQRSSETNPTPATAAATTERPVAMATQVAEKPVSPSAPAPVRPSESTAASAKAPDPKPSITPDSGTAPAAPIKELILKGPPPEFRPRWTAMKVLFWLGLGLGVAGLAVMMRLHVTRRAKLSASSATGKDDLKMPSELLFKEPMGLPQEAVATQKP